MDREDEDDIRVTLHQNRRRRWARHRLGELRAAGSDLVASELLGSLARVSPEVAKGALEAYLVMPVRRLEVDERVLRAAALINGVVNVGHDAVHAALTLLHGIGAVVTNDLGDWVRLARRLPDVASAIEGGGIEVRAGELAVISPRSFPRPVGRGRGRGRRVKVVSRRVAVTGRREVCASGVAWAIPDSWALPLWEVLIVGGGKIALWEKMPRC